MSRYCQGVVNNSKNNVKDKWWFFDILENSKDGRIDVFQKTIWLLKDLVKWTNKQPG